jgi:hypothetical protein
MNGSLILAVIVLVAETGGFSVLALAAEGR